MRISDWSSDVCSSDLEPLQHVGGGGRLHALGAEQILHADRHARKRLQRLPRGLRPIGGVGRFQRLFRRLDDEGIERLGGGDIGRSEEHTSELQSLMRISYAVFCLKKKTEIIYR